MGLDRGTQRQQALAKDIDILFTAAEAGDLDYIVFSLSLERMQTGAQNKYLRPACHPLCQVTLVCLSVRLMFLNSVSLSPT